MPAPPLPDSARVKILEHAPFYDTYTALGKAVGLEKLNTLMSRIDRFDIRGEVDALLGTGEPYKVEEQPEWLRRGGARKEPPAPGIVGTGPRDEPDVESIIAESERRYASKARRAERKKRQHIYFDHGPVCLIFVGDQHFGNAGTDVGRAFEEQKMINATPGSYVWHMGDPVDNFIVGRLMAENMKPSAPVWDQWALARHYFHEFGDKMVAYCGGNHDAWSMMLTGIDYRRDVCPEGVLYDGDQIQATVHVGDHQFKVWSRHKWSGSSMYNPTHGLERAARFDSANYDIYVGAHDHKGAMSREFVLDGERKLALLSGSYKMIDDYSTSRGFPAHDASTAVALLMHEDGSFHATSDLRAALNFMQCLYW